MSATEPAALPRKIGETKINIICKELHSNNVNQLRIILKTTKKLDFK